jgi:hypothetical protein
MVEWDSVIVGLVPGVLVAVIPVFLLTLEKSK